MDFRIPKRIIQTGKSRDLPLLEKAAVANARLLNPDFEYLFFDDDQVETFIDEKFPEYRNVFDSFQFPIQRYDFFRYLAVYHFGGFYLDLDVFLASGLSGLLDFSCVFTFEELTMSVFLRREHGMDWEVGNYAFGAAAGHPFILAVIRNCIKAQRNPDWVRAAMRPIPRMFREDFYVLNTTGPALVSRTLAEQPDPAAQVEVLFPDNVLDEGCWHQFGTLGVHLMEATWRKRNNVFRRRLTAAWTLWTLRRLLKESARLGKSRSLTFKGKPQS